MINKRLFFTSTWRRHLIYYYCFCFRSSGFVPNTTLPTPVITVRVTRRARSVDCMGVAKRYHECNTAVRPIFLMCFMCSLELRKYPKTKKKLRPLVLLTFILSISDDAVWIKYAKGNKYLLKNPNRCYYDAISRIRNLLYQNSL